MSIISLILFIVSGIFFVAAALMVICMISVKRSHKLNEEKLTIIDEITLINTDETVDSHTETTDNE